MIAAHLEPKGLEPDATPVADFYTQGCVIADAVQGSQRLRDAILNSKLPLAKPSHTPKSPSRVWKDRQGARLAVLRVLHEAARYFKISVDDLLEIAGTKRFARQRMIAMYAAREITNASTPDVGLCFGRRDHTTVLYACRVVEADPAALRHVAAIIKVLG